MRRTEVEPSWSCPLHDLLQSETTKGPAVGAAFREWREVEGLPSGLGRAVSVSAHSIRPAHDGDGLPQPPYPPLLLELRCRGLHGLQDVMTVKETRIGIRRL